MAPPKYTRIDGQNPLNYCSTFVLFVFVALCLVGIWMISSSSVIPVETEILSEDSENGTREQMSKSDTQKPKHFEDNSSNFLDDTTNKRDNNVSLNQPESKSKDGISKNTTKNATKENQEHKPGDKNESEENRPDKSIETKAKGEGTRETGKEKDTNETMDENDANDTEKAKDTNEIAKEVDTNESEKEKYSNEAEKETDSNVVENKSDLDSSEKETVTNSDENEKNIEKSNEPKDGNKIDGVVENKHQNQGKSKQSSDEKKEDNEAKKQVSNEVFPYGDHSELLNETTVQNGAWSTQASESKNEKDVQLSESNQQIVYNWKLCNVTAGPDYIPCLDNLQAIKKLRSTKHYEHRERHCPEVAPTCLVPLPEGYKRSIQWPNSRDKVWYSNVPHTKLAEYKGHQNWVKVTGEHLIFPGGGTQFKNGALHYIEFIEDTMPDIAWGKRSRVVLDVGCGVASFGGYLFEKDVITMSFAPKDEHEAQVQFALERGIPAISSVMGTKRLPFPSRAFDLVHCARCRVPWHIEGGKLLLELNRVLRPGGFFVWSATPVYQKKLAEDVEIWKAMGKLTKSMCWDLVEIKKDKLNKVGAAIYRKPSSNECYEHRSPSEPRLCQQSDDSNAVWNVSLQSCMHEVPVGDLKQGSKWPEQWPVRLQTPPYWLTSSQVGIYGKPAPEDFTSDYEHWQRVVSKSYLNGMGINWSSVRNVMDMRSVYGGFAAALQKINVWVMNVVTVDSPDTLPIIFERGLFGIYHDWCESFSTYPRSYDLLHADHLFSAIKKKCDLVGLAVEVDRILRPEGKLIVRDNIETLKEVENLLISLQWEVRLTYSKENEGILYVQKTMWRPSVTETIHMPIG